MNDIAALGTQVFYQIAWEGTKDLLGRPSTSAPKPLLIQDEEEATIVYRLMKQYAGHPAHSIPLETPGESEVFNAFGHYGIVQAPVSLLKITMVGEVLQMPN